MRYPIYRPRRIREQEHLRRMVRETRLSVDHFIYPLFVVPGQGCDMRFSPCRVAFTCRSTAC